MKKSDNTKTRDTSVERPQTPQQPELPDSREVLRKARREAIGSELTQRVF